MSRSIAVAVCLWLGLFGSAAAFRVEIPGVGELKGDTSTLVQVLIDPASVVVPTSLPTPASLTAFLLSNPEALATVARDPRYAAYFPIADSIQQGRNSIVLHGRRIPEHVRRALSPFFDASLLDSVRWTTDWNLFKHTPQTLQMFRNRDTRAITLMNAVIFRESSGVDDITLWAHELRHVKQYADWGVLEFAKRWTDNSSESGPIESEATEFENFVATALDKRGDSRTQSVVTDYKCQVKNKSVAYCDLYVANSDQARTFVVRAEARATSDGTRSGRMRLLMFGGGTSACNTDTREHGVDNDTVLKNDGFICRLRLAPGKTRRIMVVAPNEKADSTWTHATAEIAPLTTSAPVARRTTTYSCTATTGSTAYCDLTAGDDVQHAVFRVQGTARAVGNGRNNGLMRFVMTVNGNVCNPGAATVHGVDNATQLSGAPFTCNVTVSGGQTTRVELSAPNERATAEFIRADVVAGDGPRR